MREIDDFEELEATLDYVFVDLGLLERALTHVSAVADRLDSYQRLEFLGDRVLGLAVAEMLCQAFPKAAEGDLSRRLAGLVRKETCAEVAVEWGVSDFIRLGEGEQQSGGAYKEAILGDVCEAIIGAIMIDGGYAPAARLVRHAFGARIDLAVAARRDPKSAVQEWAQAQGLAPPTYEIVARSGPDHQPLFMVGLLIAGYPPIQGEGGSKRAAEQAAAAAFLARERIDEETQS